MSWFEIPTARKPKATCVPARSGTRTMVAADSGRAGF